MRFRLFGFIVLATMRLFGQDGTVSDIPGDPPPYTDVYDESLEEQYRDQRGNLADDVIQKDKIDAEAGEKRLTDAYDSKVQSAYYEAMNQFVNGQDDDNFLSNVEGRDGMDKLANFLIMRFYDAYSKLKHSFPVLIMVIVTISTLTYWLSPRNNRLRHGAVFGGLGLVILLVLIVYGVPIWNNIMVFS